MDETGVPQMGGNDRSGPVAGSGQRLNGQIQGTSVMSEVEEEASNESLNNAGQPRTSARRQRRSQSRAQEANAVRVDLATTSPAGTQPDRQKTRRRSANTLSIVSPTGEDRIILDTSDFGLVDEDDWDAAQLFDISRSVTPALSNTGLNNNNNAAGVSSNSKDIVIVQDKGRFRKATRQEVDFKPQPKQSAPGTFINQISSVQKREYQVAFLVKNVQLYSMAVSYLAFGLLAGVGLASLVVSPLTPLEIKGASSVDSVLNFVKDPLIDFFQRYSGMALGFSNIFTMLSMVVLVTAIDTSHFTVVTKKKLAELKHVTVISDNNQEPVVNDNSMKIGARLKRRTVITTLLVLCSSIVFLSTILLQGVEEIWTDAISRSDSQYTTMANSKISRGPYPLSASTYQNAGSAKLLPWYWQYALSSTLDTSMAFQGSLAFDSIWFTILNDVRGVFSMLTWLLALFEIRYRATTSPPKSVAH